MRRWKVEGNSETSEAMRARGVAETKWEAYKLAVPDIVGTKGVKVSETKRRKGRKKVSP